MAFKKGIKRFWHFLWREDSVWSWMANIIIAFILIKFLIYPGIGWILGTNLPVVAVISESMEHNGNIQKWWNSPAMCGDANSFIANYSQCTQADWYKSMGITFDDFKQYPMSNGFNKGDIIILKGINYDDIKLGDIIVFQSKLDYPIIHRVVEKNDVIQTKGDHNQRQITDARLNEKYVDKSQVIGKAWIKVPWLGWIKIGFVGGFNCLASGFKICVF